MPPKRKKEKAAEPPGWNEQHPARTLLLEEIRENRIPIDEAEMSADEVWETYKDTLEFKVRGMAFDDDFKRRLSTMREQLARHKDRAQGDQTAFDTLLRNHPPSALDHRGRPHWNGSQAQAFLAQDLQDGVIDDFDSKRDFWSSRPAYQQFEFNHFYKHIKQAEQTDKYLHTLQFRQQEKESAAFEKAMKDLAIDE